MIVETRGMQWRSQLRTYERTYAHRHVRKVLPASVRPGSTARGDHADRLAPLAGAQNLQIERRPLGQARGPSRQIGGCLLACVIVLVTRGNRDRPARPVAKHPAECCRGCRQRCGRRFSRACHPTVHRPADGIKSERFAEYQGVLAGSLLP